MPQKSTLEPPRAQSMPARASSSVAVVHDHFSMAGGGERTALALRAALDADLWTGFVCGTQARALLGADRERLRTLAPCLPLPLVRTLLLSHRMARVPLQDYGLALLSGNSALCALLGGRPGLSIAYCHSPPRYLFDQRDLLRRRVPAPLRPAADLLLREFEQRYRAALHRCDRIVANSLTVRERVWRYLGRDAEVLYPPVDTDAFAWLEDGDYFVSSARIAPLKRVEAIVRAFQRLPGQRLVVLSGGSDEQRLRRLAAGAGNISFTGWVTDARRAEIIGRCRATVYVPVDEDFGLSPVESMAAGKPVIGVREGGLRETVVHDETGILVDPSFTPGDLRDAVATMTAERARAMRAACEQRAREFSVPRFRQRLAALIANGEREGVASGAAIDRTAADRGVAGAGPARPLAHPELSAGGHHAGMPR